MQQLRATTFSERLFIEFPQYFRPYIKALGIPTTIFTDFNIEIDSLKFNTLFENAAKKEHNLGLLIGSNVKAEYFGAFGYSVKNAATVKNLVENLKRYLIVYTQGAQIEYSIEQDYFVIENPVNKLDLYSSQTVEFKLSSIVSILSNYLGQPLKIKEICFFHKKPQITSVYSQVFGCPVKFNQSSNKIILDSKILELSSVDSDPCLLQALLPYLERMRVIRNLNDLEVQLNYLIKSELSDGAMTIERASQKLGMSVRTLQRQLRNLDLSFGEIVTSVRKEKAKNYIALNNYSITQIAQFLGFKESSSFSRAFKRWYGVSPKDYIMKLREG